MKITDEDIDKLIKDDIDKDITQEDKIDESVEENLGAMGFLWERVNSKLGKDKICFECKKPIDFKSEKVKVLEASNTQPGVCAFASVCEECNAKIEEEYDKKHKKNEVKK